MFSSGNYVEARFVACALEGHDIRAFVVDDNICRMCPMAALLVGGTKIIIGIDDFESANIILHYAFGTDSPIVGCLLSVPLSEIALLVTIFRNWRARKRDPKGLVGE